MNHSEILQQFYTACAIPDPKACRALMCDDFAFNGPMMKASSADEMIAGTQQMGCAMKFSDMTMAETGDTVLAFYTCTMDGPVPISMRCAERVTFKGGRLQSSECIYDSKVFGPMS
jgi:hypothetical protein